MDTFPDLLTRNNEMAHFTASCWIVNPARTHVLMAFHNLYQSWAWLGGQATSQKSLKPFFNLGTEFFIILAD